MSDDSPFLRVTFRGGRFEKHAMPLDVLPELIALQQAILRAAREWYMQKHHDRKRVPRGFLEAAQLSITATKDNCFTAELDRTRPELSFIAEGDDDPFDSGRDQLIETLSQIEDPRYVSNLSKELLGSMARLGSRLGDDESLEIVGRSTTIARINHSVRKRLAELQHEPLVTIEELEGEVSSVSDHPPSFTLATPNRGTVNVKSRPEFRSSVADAFQARPMVRLRLRGRMQMSSPPVVLEIEALETFDHEREPDFDALHERLEVLRQVPAGWWDGEGMAPAEQSLGVAKMVIDRLLADHAWLPRPGVFPTPDGAIQAEWILDRWAVSIRFVEAFMELSAVHADTGSSSEKSLSNSMPETAAREVANWISEVTGHGRVA